MEESDFLKIGGYRILKPSIVRDVIDRLIVIAEETGRKVWSRRAFVISFLFFTGTKPTQLINTRVKHIRLALHKYRVPGSNHEISLIHVPSNVLAFWESFLMGLHAEDRVLGSFTRAGIHRLVKETFEIFGILDVKPKDLRDSLAALFAENRIPFNVALSVLKTYDIKKLIKIYGHYEKIDDNLLELRIKLDGYEVGLFQAIPPYLEYWIDWLNKIKQKRKEMAALEKEREKQKDELIKDLMAKMRTIK